jgi:serine/threonine protein kinase
LLLPIAEALDYAHNQKTIHRDVKPSNILLTQRGQPMLTDFGIAKILDLEETQDLTGTNATVGTPEYMAPEQVIAKTVDRRADIYSLGIVFYEMVTGRKPFIADTPMAVLIKQATSPLPRPKSFAPNLPDDVERILLKALAKQPDNRFQSMDEFSIGLKEMLTGKPVIRIASELSHPRGRNLDTQVIVTQLDKGTTKDSLALRSHSKQSIEQERSLSWAFLGLGILGVLAVISILSWYVFIGRPAGAVLTTSPTLVVATLTPELIQTALPALSDTPPTTTLVPTDLVNCEYTVKAGDTTERIAEVFQITPDQIFRGDDSLADLNTSPLPYIVYFDELLTIKGIPLDTCLFNGGTSIFTTTPLPSEGNAFSIGKSIEGKSLDVYRFGSGPIIRVIIGGIHGGYESNTATLVYLLRDDFKNGLIAVPENITLYLLPVFNPDGFYDYLNLPAGYANARGVDLNRNWDALWQTDWDRTKCLNPIPITAGEYPFSEPETQALRDFLLSNRVDALISYHSAMSAIFAGGRPEPDPASDRLARTLSAASLYLYPPTNNSGCQNTGQLIDWASANGIAAVDVELTAHESNDILINRKLLEAFLGWKR